MHSQDLLDKIVCWLGLSDSKYRIALSLPLFEWVKEVCLHLQRYGFQGQKQKHKLLESKERRQLYNLFIKKSLFGQFCPLPEENLPGPGDKIWIKN